MLLRVLMCGFPEINSVKKHSAEASEIIKMPVNSKSLVII